MSDALQHAPSFDEMVGLIEKLFKDYLEDVIKSKPSEIGKSWERYKTLNHLWQDEKQPGLPPLSEPILTDKDMKDWEGNKGQQRLVWVKATTKLPMPGKITWRWLDKAEAYSGYDEKRGFVYGTGGASVDPTYYSEIEWLDETAPATREDDAVDVLALMEWIKTSNWGFVRGVGWQQYGELNPSKWTSTAQVRELFKEQK